MELIHFKYGLIIINVCCNKTYDPSCGPTFFYCPKLKTNNDCCCFIYFPEPSFFYSRESGSDSHTEHINFFQNRSTAEPTHHFSILETSRWLKLVCEHMLLTFAEQLWPHRLTLSHPVNLNPLLCLAFILWLHYCWCHT